jgi:tRNA1Val (adenine37-N6)-methyltransferase
MANAYFEFKQFTIRQEHCAMKVNTDGVLLGAWANPSDAKNILDIGTGTGLIAIMLAQKSDAQIDAVEIDTNACEQGMENVKLCPWSNRISIIHSSFQDFSKQINKRYDLIVTNPPFFSNSLKCEAEKRNLARHNDSLLTEELISGVDRLLTPTGCFCLILPYVDSQTFIVDAALHLLYCNRKTVLLPNPNKKPHRVMMEFYRQRKKLVENNLEIHNDMGSYSDDYKQLTKDFYLAF